MIANRSERTLAFVLSAYFCLWINHVATYERSGECTNRKSMAPDLKKTETTL